MPLYLLWGDEDFDIELRLNRLKSSALGDTANPLNYKKFDNPSFNILDEILRTQGLMFGNILNVISAERYFLNVPKKIELSEVQVESLIKSFENLSPANHIVFVCRISREKSMKPDSRKKLFKAVEKFGTIEHFEAFKPYQDYKAIPWVQKRAKEKGLILSEQISGKLVKMSGVNLRHLDNQLNKLELLAYPNKKITGDMVEKICSETEDIYSVMDLILEGKYSGALSEISKITESSHYLPVLSFMQSAFNSLLYAKLYSSELSPFEIAKKTMQSEFIVKQNINKVRNINLDELVRIKQNLLEIEFKLKTGVIQDPVLAFSYALLNKGKKND